MWGLRTGPPAHRDAFVKIALFITCFNDTLFPDVGISVVKVLERLGHHVSFPEQQTCCGQMHFNSGYPREAARMAGALEGVFAETLEEADAIVTPSGSCAAMIREYYPELVVGRARPGPGLHVYEFTELLTDLLGVEDVGAYFPHRVTYHPTCHSLRLLRLGDRPLRLLRAVRGLELLELPGATECCGFGGTFAIKNAEVSMAMLSDKIRAIAATGAEVVTAADSSCLAQIGGGLRRHWAGIRPLHIAQILASTEASS